MEIILVGEGSEGGDESSIGESEPGTCDKLP